MPNVKIKEMRSRVSDDQFRVQYMTDGYFLQDGNWKYPEADHPVDEDGDPIEFSHPHGKIVPGEVVEVPDDHPALTSGYLEITMEKATRRLGEVPGKRKIRKRRGRPPKNVNPDNAEIRDD